MSREAVSDRDKPTKDGHTLLKAVADSDIPAARSLARALCRNGQSAWDVLDLLEPLSLGAFSHRWMSVHVSKEHEYLLRLLHDVPESLHSDFLDRFVEYLAWSPKFVSHQATSFSSGAEPLTSVTERYLDAVKKPKVNAALFYAHTAAEADGLEEVLQTQLGIGCNDLSQDIGHYYSCTDSLIRLARRVGWPRAKHHLFATTLYLMQSSPTTLSSYENPSHALNDVLARLVTKGTFVGYHYIIVANGLIKNRSFLGSTLYDHALSQLDAICTELPSTLSSGALDTLISNEQIHGSPDVLTELRRSILKAERARAFALLRLYLNDHGPAKALTAEIAHSFTRIDEHPHDPHYVTFPLAAFELLPHLTDEERELVLAQCVDFAISRVNQYGLLSF
ncbi:MAG: hypothetical protein ACXV5F_09900 [Halobacteriota archaeon]